MIEAVMITLVVAALVFGYPLIVMKAKVASWKEKAAYWERSFLSMRNRFWDLQKKYGRTWEELRSEWDDVTCEVEETLENLENVRLKLIDVYEGVEKLRNKDEEEEHRQKEV